MNYLNSPRNKVFISAYICNTLEVYDFIISGMLIPYISHLYFPLENKISVLLAGSLSFLVGFVMRPVGALFFGYIGDTYGRKKALLMSIFGMAIATFCIGILPPYATLGLMAPFLMVILRACQGFCLGGEGQGANIFVLEHFKGRKPGLVGSLLVTSNGVAAILSFFIGMVVMSPQVPEWGWRLCYIFGSFLGIMGLYLRTHISDTPAFLQYQVQKNQKKTPIAFVLRQRKLSMLAVVLYVGIGGALTYTGFTFINLFLHKFLGFSSQAALGFSMFQTVLTTGFAVLGGILCDKQDIHKVVKILYIFIVISIIPAHFLLSKGEFWSILLACILFAFGTGTTAGISPHFIASLFSTSERYSGVAFGGNIGQALLGGIQPFMAIYLIQQTNILWSPACYTFLISLLFLLFMYFFDHKLKRFQYIQERSL